ncbi:AAA family ATPase [Pseudoalteromonas phenolica]|uniref:AAA family ATPase n=1 Tax=Pseudoalteromonas phenolica TaxID=161398 RepID=UPI00384E408F
MRITKLSLTNFKSFKQEQVIEFAPVTLLFGPNSVGKSSVILSLFYLQEVLSKGQANPSRINALKSKQLGGFLSLVHGKDLSNDIIIKVELDKLGLIGKSYLSEASELTQAIIDDDSLSLDEPAFLMSSVVENSEKVELEFTIAWSANLNSAKVKSYKVWSDGKFLGELSSDLNQSGSSISRLNFTHPLLRPENHKEWLNIVENTDYPISPEALEHDSKADNFVVEANGCNSFFQFYLEEKSDTVIRPKSFDELDDDQKEEYHPLDDYSVMPISVNCRKVGLPDLNQVMDIAGIYKPDIGLNAEYLNYLQMQSVFTEIFVAPLDNLLAILEQSANIGPLRTVPDPNFITKSETEQKDWYDGRAAWDLLAADRSELSTNVSIWLNRLGTGCRVTHPNDMPSADIVTQAPFLFDENSNLPVWPSELGVGISQVIPLVVAANTVRKGIVAIEQPELHIHPRIQTELGDLLTQVNSKASFLIETHSEHLILRLLRRIRETHFGENTQEKKIGPKDVSVVYLNPSDDGVKVIHYEVTEDGDFTKDWPDGFFEERYEEQ